MERKFKFYNIPRKTKLAKGVFNDKRNTLNPYYPYLCVGQKIHRGQAVEDFDLAFLIGKVACYFFFEEKMDVELIFDHAREEVFKDYDKWFKFMMRDEDIKLSFGKNINSF